jgi:hypothetical protein
MLHLLYLLSWLYNLRRHRYIPTPLCEVYTCGGVQGPPVRQENVCSRFNATALEAYREEQTIAALERRFNS